jgi:Ser/Thr protein kinase RdoA (MazF antagonist)
LNDLDFDQIIPSFQFLGEFLDIQPFGYGHINDTYAVNFRLKDDREKQYILQRINHHVFNSPKRLMANIERVTVHLRQKIEEAGGNPDRGTITLIPTLDGRMFYCSDEGHYWRAQLMIEGAQSYQTARDQDHYYNASKAFGTFLRLLGDFPADRLYVTIPDFHHTGKRFETFIQAVEKDVANRAQAAKKEIEFVLERADETMILLDMVAQGQMPERVTHNDTKFDNVMIDDETGEGICVIDLDTVMPGLAVIDFGDSVRFAANPGGEDASDLDKVCIDLAIFDRLTHGYLDATRDFLTSAEIDNMAFGSKLITFEQGIRFLTDHLNGDSYYKIHRKNQNLYRSRTQLWMVHDMEMKYEQMLQIVEKYR